MRGGEKGEGIYTRERGKEKTCGDDGGELAMRWGPSPRCIFYQAVPLFKWKAAFCSFVPDIL